MPAGTSLEHEDLLTNLTWRDNLGAALTKQVKYSEAITLLEETLMKRESLNQSTTSPGMLCTMNNLAAALHHQAHLASAESLHRRVLEANMQTLGISHPNTITTMHNFAAVLANQGSNHDDDNAKLSEAAELLQRALSSSQTALGPSSPPSLGIMEQRVDILLRQGKYEQAEGLARTVLTQRRGMLRVQHLEIARTMHSLGLALRKLGRGDESESLRREELAFRETGEGEETAGLSGGDGQVAMRAGRYKEAESIFRQGLAASTA